MRRPSDSRPWSLKELRELPEQLASKLYQLRSTLGLSQDDVAQMAITSQGAVSRAESGKGTSISLLTYVKIVSVLVHQIHLTGARLDPGLQRFVNAVSSLVPITYESEVFLDPGLEKVIREYNWLHEPEQKDFLGIAMTVLKFLQRKKEQCESSSVDGPTPGNPPTQQNLLPDLELLQKLPIR